MHVAVYCPFLASAVLGVVAPLLARRLPPATATRLLVASALVAAASSLLAVGVLALTLVGRLPTVAAVGHWSAGALGSASPVPPVVGGVAVTGVVAAIGRGAVVAVHRARALLAARAFCRDLGGSGGQLIVTDEDIQPVAVPTGGGRILASRVHLAALPAAERRALLLHERAHLVDHHHVYRLVADLAGAVDPLQHRVRQAVRYSTERWADEVAAAAVGNRAVVAGALARSGLRSAGLPPRTGWETVALAAGGPDVVRRVRALLAPAPSQRPVLVLTAVAVVACTLTASLHAQEDSERYFGPATSTAGAPQAGDAAGGR
ncbi:M56 family peptidase [Modestobacter excelsi]|uniref:M56 family peptidase n=1 Tax=Modestobacter excelsi TaxID=2213161 RepID=UPI00110CC334|nr:M56 family peptidase [Modestobacter excelsi]